MTVSAAVPAITDEYRAYGAIARLFRLAQSGHAPSQVMVKGPAGTGKSRGVLEYLNWIATEYAGCRILMLRKTRRSLTESGMVTFERKVLHPGQGVTWNATLQRYQYPNGSVIAVAGMDKPGKVMSSEWDLIYPQEANELSEAEWEACTTRLRNGVVPWQQIVGDRNPDAPHHWLRQRELSGAVTMLASHHEDNPTLWDRAKREWTPQGAAYLAKLDELTGVRYLRLRMGVDAAAEGMVYQDAWDTQRHLVPRRTYSRKPDSLWGDCGIDPTWPRYLGIDWGYRNPAALLWLARRPDGELLLYRELYQTMRLVEDLAREALAYMGWEMSEQTGALTPTTANPDPLPREIIADHNAEDRATFERHFGLSVFPAHKGKDSIADGIQAVTKRLQDNRLHILEGSLVARDPLLDEAKKPCSVVEEFESYVWDTRAGRPPREQPIDDSNHGLDALRYAVTYFDRSAPDARNIPFEAIGF